MTIYFNIKHCALSGTPPTRSTALDAVAARRTGTAPAPRACARAPSAYLPAMGRSPPSIAVGSRIPAVTPSLSGPSGMKLAVAPPTARARSELIRIVNTRLPRAARRSCA